MKTDSAAAKRTRKLWRCCAVPLAAVSVLGAASRCGEAPPECSDGERQYEGQCVTPTVYEFLNCAEGEGVKVTRELGADVGGTFRAVVDGSVGVAYKESQEQDTAVSLRKVDHCLALAEAESGTEEERSVAREYRQRTTEYIQQFSEVLVPECTDRTQEDVSDELDSIDLEVGEITERPDEEVEVGRVVECIPAEGTALAPDSAVDLVISGPDGEGTPVPPCLGLSEAQVLAALEKADLEVGAITRQPDDSTGPGTVLACDPPPGTEVDPRSAVDLVVSSGPDPSTPPSSTSSTPPPPDE